MLLIFDSGIGGLGIAREIAALMPGAAMTYVMDNAGFPYGEWAEAELTARIIRVMGAAISRVRPDAVVVACNTASTTALASLRAQFALPFIGCVPPIKSAAAASRTGIIGVLATPATVRGPYLAELAARFAPNHRVLVHGAAGLALLAERRFARHALPAGAVRHELAGLLAQEASSAIDSVALGCTHYAWLLPELRALMPADVTWHDPAGPVARQALLIARPAKVGPGGLILYTGHPAAWPQLGFPQGEKLQTG